MKKFFIAIILLPFFLLGSSMVYPDNSSGSLTSGIGNDAYITASTSGYITAISSSTTASYMKIVVTDLTGNTDDTYLKYDTKSISINHPYISGHDYIIHAYSTSGGYYLVEPN